MEVGGWKRLLRWGSQMTIGRSDCVRNGIKEKLTTIGGISVIPQPHPVVGRGLTFRVFTHSEVRSGKSEAGGLRGGKTAVGGKKKV